MNITSASRWSMTLLAGATVGRYQILDLRLGVWRSIDIERPAQFLKRFA